MEANSMKEALRQWKLHSAQQRQAAGISTDYDGYTRHSDVRLRGVPDLPRVHDKLNIRWALRLKRALAGESSSSLKSGLWCDLSQNTHRGSGETVGFGGTLCTSSLMYSFEQDVVLDGVDTMMLQGWPRDMASSAEFTNAGKKELAGEGYHLACFALVAYGVYLNPYATWWKTS